MIDRNFLIALRDFVDRGDKAGLVDELNILLDGPNYKDAPILTAPGVLPDDADDRELRADDAGNTLVGGATDDRDVNRVGLPVKDDSKEGVRFSTDAEADVRADTSKPVVTKPVAEAPADKRNAERK